MKTKILTICTTLMLSGAAWLQAEDAAKSKAGSPEFEKMKTLVGTWKGNVDMGQGPVEMIPSTA